MASSDGQSRPVPGFNYSAALKAKGGTWTFDALNTWLTNPRADVPGTAMTFAGMPNEKQRADIIDYLNSNSDNRAAAEGAARRRRQTTGHRAQPAAASSPPRRRPATARATRKPAAPASRQPKPQ